MKQTLEQYLQQVATKLGPISHEERQDELEELRQHLEASVAASVAKGHSPAMAAEEATRQFGTASSLGRQLFFARWRRLLRRTDSVWTATVYASALIVCHISGMPPVFQWIAHLFDSGTTHHTNSTDWGLFWMLLGNPYQLLLSVLYGTILALAAPRNASRGLMVGFSLFFFATVLGMADASENPWVAGCEVFQRNWYWMAPPLIGMSCSTGLVTAIRLGAAPRRPATRT